MKYDYAAVRNRCRFCVVSRKGLEKDLHRAKIGFVEVIGIVRLKTVATWRRNMILLPVIVEVSKRET